MNLIKRTVLSIFFILITTWLLLTGLIFYFQDKLLYYPDNDLLFSPADINLNFEDVYFKSEDNLDLHGWYIKHENPAATLLFFHGNAGNISHRLESLQIFHQLGLSVFMIDYRGYGRSNGKPTEQGTYLDALAAWNYLRQDLQLDAGEIIIFGRSLGGAIASWLAVKESPKALILESTFTSIPEMGQHLYPYLPIKWLARIHYPTIDRIENIDCPLLIIHSPDDEIVPYELGQKIFEKANQPKQFLEISGDHNQGFLITGDIYNEGLRQFIY